MKANLKKTLLATACTAVLAVPLTAQATNGYFAHGYGIKAKGMAGAGIAMPQDAIAAATNPAGMFKMGNRIDVGLEIFRPDRSVYTAWPNVGAGPERWVEGNEDATFFIPEFGYNRKINDTMTLGVSVFGNGGMNSSYTEGIFATDGSKTGVDLAQLFISPTFAMKLDEQNTVGVALNLAYQRFKATGISMFCGFTPGGSPAGGGTGCNDGNAGLTEQGYDTSTGAGIRLGWLGTFDAVTVGATYQTKTRMSEFDKYNQLFAENGDFDIPANFGVGISFKANPATTVALDITRIQYSGVASISNPNTGFIDSTTPPGTGAALGDANGPGFGWEDMTVIKLGVSYQYSSNLVMRAGWNHGGQPIPAGETLFNVLAPATVEDHLTLGATWTLANGAELSGYYMHAFEKDVNGSSPGTGAGAMQNAGHSKLRMSQNAVGIAYGWAF